MPKRTSRSVKPKPRSKTRIIKPVAIEQPRDPVDFQPTLLMREIKITRPNQISYFKSITNKIVTFGLGPAGTGKSFMALWYASKLLSENKINRLIVTRPLEQCGGDKLGYMPGDFSNKMSQPMRPVIDILELFFSALDIHRLLEIDKLRIASLGYMRGSSYKDTVVVVDEAQNCSDKQLNMLLTRMDYGSKLIFSGDEKQSDIGNCPPLVEKVNRLMNPTQLDNIGLVRFTRDDNMRPDFVRQVCERLDI